MTKGTKGIESGEALAKALVLYRVWAGRYVEEGEILFVQYIGVLPFLKETDITYG